MIALERLDNDLSGWLARTLIAPGLLPAHAFEDAFVSIVTAAGEDADGTASPDAAWLAFYRNTLAALAGSARPGGTNAEMAPVHARAAELVVGSEAVELGCCFGFLALRLAAAGLRVTAVDISRGTIALLSRMAPRLGAPLAAVIGDATAAPLRTGCADTVLAVHLLEHLPEPAGAAVLREMLRLARRRVVVAVPYEDEPDPTWGHVRRFGHDELRRLGAQTGREFQVTDHHGGWLVIDRGSSATRSCAISNRAQSHPPHPRTGADDGQQ
jgi:SAM-dependent methyltransferase